VKKRRRHKSNTRIVQYRFVTAARGEQSISETAIEKELSKARQAGTVSMHDTGRGYVTWFEGAPGPELRRVRARVLVLIAEAKKERDRTS
jgi:hypothetical protein